MGRIHFTSPPVPQASGCYRGVVCLVLSAGPRDTATDHRFIRLPSASRSLPLKRWTVRGLPHSYCHVQEPHPLLEEDLLVVWTVCHRQSLQYQTCVAVVLGHSRYNSSGCLTDNLTPVHRLPEYVVINTGGSGYPTMYESTQPVPEL